MNDLFGTGYSNSYDLLYSDKDYGVECDLIVRAIGEYGLNPTRSILDLGCGTGNHALPLARRGYEVVGIDRSEQMLALARTKARDLNAGKADFSSGDIRSADLGRKFDATLMMFAVLGYQLYNEDVLSALRTARQHITPGGVLIFDVWYGPAVLNLKPSERAKVIPIPDGQILRFADGNLNISDQICTVNYRLWRIKDDRVITRIEESHQVRYFFPRELDLLLESSGFRRVRTSAFPEFEREPDETTWNALVIAQTA